MEIKTPSLYINEIDAIDRIGIIIKNEVNHPLIVWSKSAKRVTQDKIATSLEAEKISYAEVLFEGFPTIKKAEQYAKKALEEKCDAIIAVGGGKVMDVSKAAGNKAKIKIITVPTIAATCASWAAVSIIYTEEGDFEQFVPNKKTADIIIADTKIIAQAPVRYIRAGIVDTLAKWYETAASEGENNEFSNSIAVLNSKVALDFLLKNSTKIIQNIENGIIDDYVKKTIDAIIYIAGNVGSYVGDRAFSGFAHPFYHAARRIPETRNILHGELVAVGLLIQAVLEERNETQIKEIIRQFGGIGEAFTLEESGLGANTREKLEIVANRIIEEFGSSSVLKKQDIADSIISAAILADRYVREVRKEG